MPNVENRSLGLDLAILAGSGRTGTEGYSPRRKPT